MIKWFKETFFEKETNHTKLYRLADELGFVCVEKLAYQRLLYVLDVRRKALEDIQDFVVDKRNPAAKKMQQIAKEVKGENYAGR